MATTTERARLRADLQLDTAAISDAAIDDWYTRAAADHPAAIDAAARLLACRGLLAAAAKSVDTAQAGSRDAHSQRFAHLERLAALYMNEIAAAEAREQDAAVRWGALR